MTDHPLRIAVLGVRHPHVFARVELIAAGTAAHVVGFWEPDHEIAARFEQRTGLPGFERAEDLLATGVDAAIVEGLDPRVPELAERATAAGVRSVLLEKPGAANPAAFYELAARLEAGGTVVEMGYELHYSTSVELTRRVLAVGALGDITLARFHGGCPVGAGAELWQSIPEDIGGLVYTEGSHMLEIVAYLFGAPRRVSSTIRRLPAGSPTEALVHKPDLFSPSRPDFPVAVGTLRHEDVGAALLDYRDKVVTVDFTAWEPTYWCWDWAIEIYGTNGVLHAVPDPARASLTLRRPAGGFSAGTTEYSEPSPLPGGRSLMGPYRRQMDTFLARVRGETDDQGCGLALGTSVMRMLEAMYVSSARQDWVELPTAASGAVAGGHGGEGGATG